MKIQTEIPFCFHCATAEHIDVDGSRAAFSTLGSRDRTPSPEDNKRKLRSSKGSQNKNIKLEVIDVE